MKLDDALGRILQDERGCWIVQGRKPSALGYLQTGHPNSTRCFYMHRLMYQKFRGPIPAGLHIDHLCRNRACQNPWHMEPVTRGENVRRGESPSGLAHRQTHCTRGSHSLSGDNLYVTPTGRRRCRACARERQRRLASAG